MTTRTRTAEGLRTADGIREAAADLFFQHGYEATSLRQIAGRSGLQVGSLYNHMRGKEDLLAAIMVDIMEGLLSAQEEALDGLDGEHDRLRAFLHTHIRFHADRARDVFIGNTELRSLSKPNRRKVVALRDRYEQLLRSLIDDLAKTEGADIIDARMQTYAVLALGGHVASWYDPSGEMSLETIAETYMRIALRQLGVDDAVAGSA